MFFQDLPDHLLRKIASHMYPTEAVILSTCHSALHVCGLVSRIYFMPHTVAMIESFCRWLRKRPHTLAFLALYDLDGLIDDPHIAETLYSALEYAGSALEDVVIGSRSQPEDLIQRLPSVRHVTIYDGAFPQIGSLARNERLKVLCLKSGLHDIEDGVADLHGIAYAPALEKLVILQQPGHLCLCMVPKLRQLRHLEIVGTRRHSNIVTNLRHLRSLPHLEHLILDSSTPMFDEEMFGALKHLKTFDVSKRHPDHLWIWDDEHFSAALNGPFLDGVRAMKRLEILGCRDIILNDTFYSGSIAELHVTNESLSRSLDAGFRLDAVPNLRYLVIDGSCSANFPAYLKSAFVSMLQKPLTVTLHRSMRGDRPLRENSLLTFWLSVASQCPAVTFVIE